MREEVDGVTWLTHVDARPAPDGPSGVHLLPQWDEFLLGYKSRDVTLPPEHRAAVVPGRNMVFAPTLVVDGEVAGIWRRQARGGPGARARSRPSPRSPRHGGVRSSRRPTAYGRFVGQPVEVVRGGAD